MTKQTVEIDEVKPEEHRKCIACQGSLELFSVVMIVTSLRAKPPQRVNSRAFVVCRRCAEPDEISLQISRNKLLQRSMAVILWGKSNELQALILSNAQADAKKAAAGVDE